MSGRRLVVPAGWLREGGAELPADVAHHVARVLRLQPETQVRLHDGAGAIADATLTTVSKSRVEVQVRSVRHVPAPSPALELLQAVGKGDKVDVVVRQTAELGVSRIMPVHTARGVARHDKRVERWRTIAEDGVRIAGHAWRPAVSEVRSLTAALASVEAAHRLVFCLEGAAPLEARLAERPAGAGLALLVGPEGGLTADEVAEAEAAGFLPTHLGPATLRTETAGAAVVAISAYALGRFA